MIYQCQSSCRISSKLSIKISDTVNLVLISILRQLDDDTESAPLQSKLV